MTNYIEEMMKTAGVEKYKHFRQYNFAQVLYGKEELKKSQENGVECIRIRNCQVNDDCIYWTELHFPRFTAEKQLEIIKLIASNSINTHYRNLAFDKDEIDNNWYFRLNVNDKVNAFRVVHQDFTQALAKLTTEFMNAGELDKSKVKEILL